MYNISTVSYFNTAPFIHGINNSGLLKKGDLSLSKDIPSVCAEKFIKKKADIVLVPVAALAGLNSYNIISDYCIGATRNVASVVLCSNKPLSQIKNIYLDYQSRTSNMLVKVLARHHWKKKFNWLNSSAGYEIQMKPDTAGVIIGDRALAISGLYMHCYDLADEWNDFTGLPFVFAVWISTKKIDGDFLLKFNKSLEWGIKNIDTIKFDYPVINRPHIIKYLKHNIEYNLDDYKKKGMKLFLKYIISP